MPNTDKLDEATARVTEAVTTILADYDGETKGLVVRGFLGYCLTWMMAAGMDDAAIMALCSDVLREMRAIAAKAGTH